MDTVPFDTTAAAPDDGLDGIRRRLGDVVHGAREDPVDVRAYLLDPPPTVEEAARDERRRMLVRRGSIAGAAVLAVLLLAPIPGGAEDADPAPSAAVEEAPSPAQLAQPQLLERVDTPTRPAAGRTARGRQVPAAPRRHPRPKPVATATARRTAAASLAAPGADPVRSPAPHATSGAATATRAPTTATTQPRPVGGTGGALVPIA